MSMYLLFPKKVEEKFAYLPSTIQAIIQEYVHHQTHRQLSPHTIQASIAHLNNLFHSLNEHQQSDIRLIVKSDIRHYVESLSDRHLSASSINGALSAFKAFFAYLIDEEYLERNPVLRRYYIEEPQRLPRPMPEKDLAVFLSILKEPRDRAMFLLMVRSGLRVGEVTRLRLGDIHWKSKQIIVYNGKGKVDRVVYFPSEVEIALSEWLWNQRPLREWLEEQGFQSSWCFNARRKQGEALVCTAVRHRMRQLLESCGLQGKGYSPHVLRHTFATQMLNAGLPLEVLKNLMGHKSYDQTLMYAQLSDKTIRNSYDQAMRHIEWDEDRFQEVRYELS